MHIIASRAQIDILKNVLLIVSFFFSKIFLEFCQHCSWSHRQSMNSHNVSTNTLQVPHVPTRSRTTYFPWHYTSMSSQTSGGATYKVGRTTETCKTTVKALRSISFHRFMNKESVDESNDSLSLDRRILFLPVLKAGKKHFKMKVSIAHGGLIIVISKIQLARRIFGGKRKFS